MVNSPLPPEDRDYYPIENGNTIETVELLEGSTLTCPSHWQVPKQRYSYHRMYYVEGGEVFLEMGDVEQRLKPGHLYVFPSRTVSYGLRHNPLDPFRVLWCHFSLIPDMQNGLIDLNLAEHPALRSVIAGWKAIAGLEKPGNEIWHLLSVILYLINRNVKLDFLDSGFGDFERYLSAHMDTDINVETLAERFGYTRAHFTRKFKADYGLSPGEYLRMLRMSRASNMLLSGYDLSSVCAKTGYTNRKVFSRAFKEYFGVCPSDFKYYFRPRDASVVFHSPSSDA